MTFRLRSFARRGRGRAGTVLAALVVVAGSGLAARTARAQAAVDEASPLPAIRPPTWEVTAGVRTLYVHSAGFEPFSDNAAFVAFSLTGARQIVRAGEWSLAAGLGLDAGSTDSSARGEPSSLTLTRASALLEGRFQPAARFYAFVRATPGLLHGSASVDDPSSPAGSSLAASFDRFSLDGSAGAALCFGALGGARLGAWLVADAGYAWAGSQHLVLAPSLGADQDKTGSLDLGPLAPRGGFFRVAMALSY